ncbi:cobalamin biosynthesis protein [Pseudonocardia hispaniensis]|uniref:Cobalamin biosynthesis protein n=1 Tax=Pseudonocardia hispaniensis TaxID=904933 RepID=A0ABW1IYD8_9PSEU
MRGPLVVGLGSARGVPPTAVRALLHRIYDEHDLDPRLVRAYASVDRRAAEPGLLGAIAPAPLRTFPAALLDAVAVPNPSARARAAVGTGSVAEAAAFLAAAEIADGDWARLRLVVPKTTGDRVTAAVVRIGLTPRV